MILKLQAIDFGKFKGRVFELGPVTVVHGANEAGKTTFFDALFQALCRPSETRLAGKALKKRYGADRKAEAVLQGDAGLDEDEFLNLCAIRAGDLSIELGKGSPWIEALKARLFHGGLDPAALAIEFEKRGSDKRTFAHVKEMEGLREKAARVRQELEGRRRERDGLLAEEKALAAAEASLEETRRLRGEGMDRLREAAGKLAFEEKVERRRKLAERLALLDRRGELEARLESLEAFREDRRPEWEALAAATRSAAEAVHSARARLELLEGQSARARAEERRLEDLRDYHAGRAKPASDLAAGLRGQAADVAPPLPPWLPALIVLAPLLGAAAAWFLPGAILPAAAVLLGLAAGAGLLLRGRRRAAAASVERAASQLASAKDRFAVEEMVAAARHPGAAGEPRLNLADLATREGLLQAFDRIVLEGENAERQFQDGRRHSEGLAAETAQARTAAAEAVSRHEEAARAEKEWLSRHGVDQPETYALQVARYAEARSELARRQGEAENAGPGPEAERRDLERQLRGLDEEGIPAKGMDEASLQRLRNQLRDLEADKVRRDLAIEEATGRNAHQAGRIRGTLGKLAGEIVKAEEELLDLEARIAAKELDRQAAGVAAEIFREIGEGADLLLKGLAGELQSMLSHILPGDRTVAMLGLDQKQILVQDAAGEARALDNLSSGTQDAVVLAAKLALALKTRPDPGVLVLDDPFQAMDRFREERALAMLQDFHLRHGWQIILLTKDAHLRDGMARIFRGLKVLEL